MDREATDKQVKRAQRQLARAWTAMVAHLREQNTVDAIAQRLRVVEHGDVIQGLRDAIASFAAAEHAAFGAAGQATARWLEDQVTKHRGEAIAKKLLHFDAADPPAVRWAERNRLDLIRDITDQQRMLIRDALIGGAETSVNPRVTAREIRDSIGLTAAQERAVQSYRRALEQGQFANALGRELRDGRYDRTVQAAQRDGKPLAPVQVDTMVDRYRGNFVMLRAETIARTEGMRVTHQGSGELYRQAIERGDLQPEQIERKWLHTTRGNHSRDHHATMNGQIRGWDEPFTSGLGASLMYPGDPSAGAEESANCRCTVVTRILPGKPVPRPAPLRPAVPEPAPPPAAAQRLPLPPSLPPAPPPQPSLAQQHELQQAEQRLAERREALEAARARVEQEEAAHAQTVDEHAEAEHGFRIGEGRIAGETEVDEVDWLAEQRAANERAIAEANDVEITVEEPARPEVPVPPRPRDTPLPTTQPAPFGYTAIEYNDEIYFRNALTGRSYTPAQLASIQGGQRATQLTGPNEHIDGYQTWEVDGEIRYRGPSQQDYTLEQVRSGEAAETEDWIRDHDEAEAKRPGFFARLAARLTGRAA